MTRNSGTLAIAGILCISLAHTAVANPVVMDELVRSTPAGFIRGYVATVDLTDPSVEIVTTAGSSGQGEVTLTTVPTWRSSTNCWLAVNANFFSSLGGNRADIIGLSVDNGTIVSPYRQFGALPDPAITFTSSRVPTVGNISSMTGVWDAIAGVGPSNTDTDPGTLLVTDGVNTGATARVTPSTREPRTAVGINQAGTRLIIMVVDGRQAGWSEGVTLPEMADLMIERGVWRAINLDGGGSSSFVYSEPGKPLIQNKPSDGSHRAVANHLGIRVTQGTTTDLTKRPIRGAWLRPPGAITGAGTSFEAYLQTLAPAGIQDIFLETLYWGRDTGTTGVFPARFAFDYLQQACVIAAKYSVRVHAWCETGYLDFGTTPSALLQANPDWIVDHRDPANTTTGDQANQRFVNLGNPGVRSILQQYVAALGANYPGLYGIQCDYNFFPLAASNAAPWSFDSWARGAYQAQYGVDPVTEVNTAATSYPTRWLTWNRNNVTQSLVGFRASADGASSSPVFSTVGFSAWNTSTHTSKMIDLQSWGTTNAAELYFVMAYFASTTSINNDLATAKSWLPGKRVVAGLANLTSSARPSITDQLNTAKGQGLEDFSWFDAPTFITNSAGTAATMRTELRNWIDSAATPQRGDISNAAGTYGRDGYIDARDVALFDATFTGTPVARNAGNFRIDLNADAIINAADRVLLMQDFVRFRFGDDGRVDARDLAFFDQCVGATAGAAGILHLFDLNGDGSVNATDRCMLLSFATTNLGPSAPVVTAAPTGGTYNAGAPVTLNVVASGPAPLSYQWRRNSINLSNGGGISGATSASLAIASASPVDSGLYDVVISNACGNRTTTPVLVTVNACAADLDDGSGTGVQDGGVDINDLLYFLAAFEAGSALADLDDGSQSGSPDGGVDINDLLFFLTHFESGC